MLLVIPLFKELCLLSSKSALSFLSWHTPQKKRDETVGKVTHPYFLIWAFESWGKVQGLKAFGVESLLTALDEVSWIHAGEILGISCFLPCPLITVRHQYSFIIILYLFFSHLARFGFYFLQRNPFDKERGMQANDSSEIAYSQLIVGKMGLNRGLQNIYKYWVG